MEAWRSYLFKGIFHNKNKVGGITVPNFRISYTAVVIETAWYKHKNQHVDQENRIEVQEINLHTSNQLIFDRESVE